MASSHQIPNLVPSTHEIPSLEPEVSEAVEVKGSSSSDIKEYDLSTEQARTDMSGSEGIKLKVGETCKIILSSNPTTGYNW